MQWIVQTTLLFALFYLFPWFGDLVPEAKETGAAAVAAVLASCVLTLLWEMLKAPSRLDQQRVARVNQLESVLSLNDDERSIIEQGAAICERARQIGMTGKNELIPGWLADAEAFVRGNYHASVFFRYETGATFTHENSQFRLFQAKADRLYEIVYGDSPLPVRHAAQLRQLG